MYIYKTKFQKKKLEACLSQIQINQSIESRWLDGLIFVYVTALWLIECIVLRPVQQSFTLMKTPLLQVKGYKI
jgi:hypothetical protein